MAYAKAHSLMNKQTINADASLRKLLTLAEGDKLTILNLQKFLRRHYIKATPVAA
jgi:chromatin remodeling complex protein RSC6